MYYVVVIVIAIMYVMISQKKRQKDRVLSWKLYIRNVPHLTKILQINVKCTSVMCVVKESNIML